VNDHFSQSKVPQWSYNCYASHTGDCPTSKTSIGWLGCGLTAFATLVNHYASNYTDFHISTTNPGNFNDWLKENNGYNVNNDVQFDIIKKYTAGKIKLIESEKCDIGGVNCKTKQGIIDKIKKELLSGRVAILKLIHTAKNKDISHYVVVTGKCDDSYMVSDPAGGREYLYDPYDKNYRLSGIRVFKFTEGI
jgi:hypothetical protein